MCETRSVCDIKRTIKKTKQAHTRARAHVHTHTLNRSTGWISWNSGMISQRWVLRFLLKQAREEDWRISDGSEFQTVGA